MNKLIEKAAVLIEALPYIQEFRGSTVLVKFGGSAMEDPETTRSVIRDIVFMECAGMKPIVVHGGGKAITAALKEAGVPTRFINGLRYTCEPTMEIVDRVLHGTVNAALVGMMRELGGRPFPLSGKFALRGEKVTTTDADTGADLDLGLVGRVVNVDTQQIRWILDRGEVPVITPVAKSMDGQTLNINADMAACEIAAHLKARKLVFLSDVPGVLRDPADESSLISSIRRQDVEGLIRDGVLSGGMVPKVNSAAAAIDGGVSQVHMIDGRIRHSLLLEIFTDKGIGTQITAT